MTTIDQRILDALNRAGIDHDAESFSPDRSFRDNGIDSLDVMGLFLALEETHGVKFSATEAEAINTPAELSLTLDRKLG
ncbi:MAG: acyl carrier protein [Rhodanobacteraceae bacterium]